MSDECQLKILNWHRQTDMDKSENILGNQQIFQLSSKLAVQCQLTKCQMDVSWQFWTDIDKLTWTNQKNILGNQQIFQLSSNWQIHVSYSKCFSESFIGDCSSSSPWTLWSWKDFSVSLIGDCTSSSQWNFESYVEGYRWAIALFFEVSLIPWGHSLG